MMWKWMVLGAMLLVVVVGAILLWQHPLLLSEPTPTPDPYNDTLFHGRSDRE